MSTVVSSIQGPQLVISWPSMNSRQNLGNIVQNELTRLLDYRPGMLANLSIQTKRQTQVLTNFQNLARELITGIALYDISDQAGMSYARTVISSAPDKIQAEALDRAPTGLHHVEVSNLSYPQTNVSVKLITTEPVSLEAGEYVFSLTVGDETSSVDVTVVKTGYGADTNLDFLAKVGREIMKADDRLTALLSVTTEPDTDDVLQDWVTLTICSSEIGPDTKFYMNDTTGNLVETLGLNQQTISAWPAKVVYDHLAHESNTNVLEISNDQLTLRLLNPTTSTETIVVEKELEALPEQSRNLVKQYNELIQFLKNQEENIKPIILTRLRNNQESLVTELRQIGLISVEDGQIKLTDQFFEMLAAKPEKVRETLLGPDGFFSGAGEILADLLEGDVRHYAQPIETVSYSHPANSGSYYQVTRLYNNLSLIV